MQTVHCLSRPSHLSAPPEQSSSAPCSARTVLIMAHPGTLHCYSCTYPYQSNALQRIAVATLSITNSVFCVARTVPFGATPRLSCSAHSRLHPSLFLLNTNHCCPATKQTTSVSALLISPHCQNKSIPCCSSATLSITSTTQSAQCHYRAQLLRPDLSRHNCLPCVSYTSRSNTLPSPCSSSPCRHTPSQFSLEAMRFSSVQSNADRGLGWAQLFISFTPPLPRPPCAPYQPATASHVPRRRRGCRCKRNRMSSSSRCRTTT